MSSSDRDDPPEGIEVPRRKNSFASPSAATSDRGLRRSTNESRRGGTSRRSTSLMQTPADVERLDQLHTSTRVHLSAASATAIPTSPRSEASVSSSVVDLVMENVQDVMRSCSPASDGSHILLESCGSAHLVSNDHTPDDLDRRPHHLDLRHNDDTFHVLASLLVEFFQSKVVGRTLVLLPHDKEMVARMVPPSAVTDFIDATRYRLEVTPVVTTLPIQFLTLQCQELCLDRTTPDENPILACLMRLHEDPITMQVLSVLDEYTADTYRYREEDSEHASAKDAIVVEPALDSDVLSALHAPSSDDDMDDMDGLDLNTLQSSSSSSGTDGGSSTDESMIHVASSRDIEEDMQRDGLFHDTATDQLETRVDPKVASPPLFEILDEDSDSVVFFDYSPDAQHNEITVGGDEPPKSRAETVDERLDVATMDQNGNEVAVESNNMDKYEVANDMSDVAATNARGSPESARDEIELRRSETDDTSEPTHIDFKSPEKEALAIATAHDTDAKQVESEPDTQEAASENKSRSSQTERVVNTSRGVAVDDASTGSDTGVSKEKVVCPDDRSNNVAPTVRDVEPPRSDTETNDPIQAFDTGTSRHTKPEARRAQKSTKDASDVDSVTQRMQTVADSFFADLRSAVDAQVTTLQGNLMDAIKPKSRPTPPLDTAKQVSPVPDATAELPTLLDPVQSRSNTATVETQPENFPPELDNTHPSPKEEAKVDLGSGSFFGALVAGLIPPVVEGVSVSSKFKAAKFKAAKLEDPVARPLDDTLPSHDVSMPLKSSDTTAMTDPIVSTVDAIQKDLPSETSIASPAHSNNLASGSFFGKLVAGFIPPTVDGVSVTDKTMPQCEPAAEATKATIPLAPSSDNQGEIVPFENQEENAQNLASSKHAGGTMSDDTTKQQLVIELNEACQLMEHSVTPETSRFWQDHVRTLQSRIATYDTERGLAGQSSTALMLATSRELNHTPIDLQRDDSLFPDHVPEENDPSELYYAPPHSQDDCYQELPELNNVTPPHDLDHSNQIPQYHIPKVDVVAPADLPGGYHFEAEIEGQRFLATVPPGGVQQGETFTCLMRELDSVAIDIPVGYWKDGLCSICELGWYHPVVWCSIFCPLVTLGQIQTRIQLDFLGRPKFGEQPSAVSTRTMMLSLIIFWGLTNIALFGACNLKWSRGLELSVGDIFAVALVNLVMFGFIVFVTQSTRSSLREKFMIREERCFDLEDICYATACLPCTVGQMARHTANYDDYEAVCCSKTGLPNGVRVNRAPLRESDGLIV